MISDSSVHPEVPPRLDTAGSPLNRLSRALGAALALYLGLWNLLMLGWPFGRDQGILAWAGSVIRSGGALYRDAWEVKGPAAVVPFTVAQIVFGSNMWGIRLIDLVLYATAAWVVSLLATRLWDRKAGLYTFALVWLFTASLNFSITAQPDTWCGCAIAAVIALLWRPGAELGWQRVASSGALIGLCTLQKPVYGLFLILLVPLLPARSRTLNWAAALAGFALPIAATIAWFAATGALGDFVQTYLLFNLHTHLFVRAGSLDARIQLFFYVVRSMLPLTIGLPLAAIGCSNLFWKRSSFAAVYCTWVGLDLALIVIQGKYFEYQWVFLWPPIALAAGLGLRVIYESMPPSRTRWGMSPSGAACLLILIAPLLLSGSFHLMKVCALYRTGQLSRDGYDDEFTYLGKSNYDYLTIRRIADYLRAHTQPGEAVEVWGYDAGINYVSQRPAPTRFGYVYPLAIGEANAYEREYRQQFMSGLRKRRPRYILIASGDNFGMTRDSMTAYRDFKEFNDFVKAGYLLETRIGNWFLFRGSDSTA